MINPPALYRHYGRQLAVLAALGFASALCLALLAARALYTREFTYIGLAWNLFLAWLPLAAALAAYNLHKSRSRLSWLMVTGCALAWLLFFPNAPYLVTDLIHLRSRSGAPLWYDLILVAGFAGTGLSLGLVSLFLMQQLVRSLAGRLAGWLTVVGVIGLSGFGIYLGRFLRWNSWDVLINPLPLLADIYQHLRHPLAHARTFAFSGLFSLLTLAAYLILVAIIHLPREAPARE